MNTKTKPGPESMVREIKRKTRRKYSAEEKIRIVLEGLRGEQSITDLSRREGIHPGIYNHRYHEAIDNVTPSDRFYGKDKEILKQRQRTKTETMSQRRKIYRSFLINHLMENLN
jgi:transposase